MRKQEKAIVWLHGEVKTPPFSKEARLETGYFLRLLQKGENLSMPQSRPMVSIGEGCHELRITDQNSIWRIFYLIESDAIVILEVCKKKTQETPKKVINNCQKRISEYKETIL